MPKSYLPLDIYPVKPPPMENTIDCHPDYYDLNQGSCVVHVAKSKSGKGVCCVNQILNPAFDLANKLDIIHIYSPTAKSGDISWRHVVEQMSETIYSEYSDSHLKSIIDEQLKYPKNSRPRIAVIFDDIGALPNITKNSLLWKLSTMYRHAGIKLLYYMIQQFKMVMPIVRANMDYCLISRTTNEKEVQDMSNEISSKYDGDKQFRKLLVKATSQPYHFLYLRLNDQPATAFDCFNKKIYTAKMLGSLDVDFGNLRVNEKDADENKIEKNFKDMEK